MGQYSNEIWITYRMYVYQNLFIINSHGVVKFVHYNKSYIQTGFDINEICKRPWV